MEALNRGVLIQSVIKEWTKRDTLKGNIVFGKATCPYCVKAKQLLDALYRMIPEVKAIIGEKTPVTVPQIWLDGSYIGGCDKLEVYLKERGLDVVPNNVVEMAN